MSSLPMAFATLVASLAYVGLAVVGYGGLARFFAEPALRAATGVLFSLMAVALFSDGNLSGGVREDRSNRWVVAALTGLGLLQAYLPALCDRKDFWTLGGEGVRWLGVALFTGGGLLRLWPVFVLGNRFSGFVAIQPGHKLVTGGLYSVIRHPSYLGLLVNSVGWALTFRSGVGLLLSALMVPVVLARIHSEENLLARTFGPDYEAYRRRTSRLIPGVY